MKTKPSQEPTMNPTEGWKPFREAFDQAIQEGRLSADPRADNFAGHYMYMGPAVDGKRDAFKHIITRAYIQ